MMYRNYHYEYRCGQLLLFFDCCGRIADLLPMARGLQQALFINGVRSYVRDALVRRKQDDGVPYFDDLVTSR